MPLVIVGMLVSGALLAWIVVAFQQAWIPDDALLARWTRLGGILMFVPLFFPALVLGALLGNLIAWTVPPARRAFDAAGPSFGKAMKPLAIAAAVVVPLSLAVSFAGAVQHFYVLDDGVHVRAFSATHHAWEDVRSIEARCHAERRNLHLNYRLKMADGSTVDLMQEAPVPFAKAFPRIAPRLKGIPVTRTITPAGRQRLEQRHRPENVRLILSVLEESP